MRKSRTWALTAGLMLVSLILTACQGQQVQVPVTVVVKETSVVEQTSVVVETQVVNQTQVVEVTAEPAGAFTTPHPILSDLKVRQAIAHCTDRASLIKSVYPFVSEADQANQLMDTNIPRVSWAFYGGPEVQSTNLTLPRAWPCWLKPAGPMVMATASWTRTATRCR
jgi:ABC-type transport system substrate-binding protein